MTKDQKNVFQKLNREEKIELVQELWDDISSAPPSTDISDEHKKILEETLSRIEDGKSQFSMWEDVKVKYGKRK